METALDYFNKIEGNMLAFSLQYGTGDKEIIIFGGTHGNEPAGVEAIVQTHHKLVEERIPVRGRITLVLGNPAAYQQFCNGDPAARYVDEDLNRVFKEHICGNTVEGKRALEIKQYLHRNQDKITGLLDLHSVSKGDFKMVAYAASKSNTELALAVSPLELHFAYHSEHLNGLLMDAATQLGIKGLVIECGNHASPTAIDTAKQHINTFLQCFGMIDEPLSLFAYPNIRPTEIRCYETIAHIPVGNNFRFMDENIVSEVSIRKGEAFAQNDEGIMVAPEDCYVMMPSKYIKPADRDAGFLCKKILKRKPLFSKTDLSRA